MKKLLYLSISIVLACNSPQKEKPVSDLDIQGHRGARGLYPENSLIGFEKALEMGVTTLELDLCVSQDSQLIVSHEPYFSSTICLYPDGTEIPEDSAQELNMYEMSYEEISGYDCGSKGNPGFPEQKKISTSKPLLTQVFDRIESKDEKSEGKKVRYNIEIKSLEPFDNVYHPSPPVFSDLVYQTINDRIDWSRITIQSFDFRVLQYFNQNYPEVRLALLIENDNSWQDNLDSLGFTPDIYSCYYKHLTVENTEALKYMEMQVIPWTVNNEEDMKKLVKMGVDGLITDYPDRAIELFY